MHVAEKSPVAAARRRRIGLRVAVTVTILLIAVGVLVATVLLRPQLFVGVPAPVVDGDVDRLAVGDVVPTISGGDFERRQVVIDPSTGAKVLLFAAHWCDHCQAELEMLEEARQTGELDLGVPLVVISTRHIPGVRWPPDEALDLHDAPDAVLVDTDSSLAQTFDVQSVPQWFFLDEDGRIVAEQTGELALVDIQKYVADASDRSDEG